MSRLAALIVAVGLAACGGSAPPVQGATASSVAVQTGDVPASMEKCDLSGDIDSFLAKEKTADPSTYKSTKDEWDAAKSKGATSAYVAIYADSKAHCDAIKSSGPDIGAATYKLVINFVIQFKNEASAAKAYTSEKIFNISAADLKTTGPNAVEGSKTGLSSNSIVLDTLITGQSYYIAVWQNKAKKVSTSENGRIK